MSVSRALATYNPREMYKGQWWTLFAMAAFPLHLWTLIQIFRDVNWLSQRSNSWDAVGVGAYGLLFALLESLFVFIIMLLLGLLVHPNWGKERRAALLSIGVLLVATWAMINQLFFIQGWGVPLGLTEFLAATAHPLRWLYAIVFALVLPSITLPFYLLLRYEKALQTSQELIDRLTLLSSLYLLLDAGALVVVVVRNL